MPKCARCGARVWAMELDDAGLCARCIENEKDADQKRALIRKQNYQHFLAHEVEHKSQRIFDAFIKKYPDALITGISVQDSGSKLLIYLDGNPMYYATFNPLTNDVDLVKYDALQETGTSFQQPQKTSTVSSSRRGCLSFLLKCTIIVSIILIISYILIEIAYYQNEHPPVISTISPQGTATASPTPTALASDPLSWCKYYANKYTTNDIRLRSVDITTTDHFGTYLTVDFDIKCDHSNTKLQFAHFNEVIIDICEAMSKHDGFDSIMFSGYDDFVNKYGEVNNINSIIADYSISTLRRINYDYHRSYIYSNPTAFIECAETHFVHQGYNLD